MFRFTVLCWYYHPHSWLAYHPVAGAEEIEEKFETIWIGGFGDIGGFDAAREAERRNARTSRRTREKVRGFAVRGRYPGKKRMSWRVLSQRWSLWGAAGVLGEIVERVMGVEFVQENALSIEHSARSICKAAFSSQRLI